MIIIIILLIIVFILIKSYRIKYDHVVCFTGGLGSGKSYLSVQTSLKILRRLRFKTKLDNLFILLTNLLKKAKKPLKERPMLYSSIPVRISKKEWALELREEHLLLQNQISYRAVVYIDEVGSWASQFDYKNPNILDNFDEFVRLYRHYTKGGYIIVNDQCSENVVLEIRRRLNQVFNLMHFRKFLFLFYTVKIRNMSISEEIKTIEEQDTEDNMTTKIGLINPFFRHYDTYCYSERYITVFKQKELPYSKLKKYKLLKAYKTKVPKYTTDIDPN